MMAEIRITADTAQAKSAIDRLNASLDSIENSSRRAEKSLGNLNTVAGVAAGAFAALSAGVGIREIVDITGRFTDLNSRLINATGSAELAAEAFEGIKKSARTTYQPLEQTAEVFLRNSVALNELGYTTNEQIKISSALGNAMAVSGAKGERAASALDAFQKSIATGKMTTEEFNRAITNAPALVEALAAGLGMSVDQLRKMAAEGRLTSDVMIPALLTQFDILEKKAKDMPATMSDGFMLISNSFFEFIGKMDQALGSSELLSGALEYLADNIELVIGFALGVGVAVAALTLKMMGLATATAIATGGLSILLAGAAGAAMAKLAKDMGLFAFMAEKAVDPVKEKSRALEEAAKKQEREAKAAQRALEAQQTGLKALFDRIKLESNSIGLSEQDLAIKKNIAEAAKILKVEEDKISASVRARIVNETTALIQKKQAAALDKVIADLESEKLNLSTQDRGQREITVAIRRQELEFGRSLNDQERERLTTAIQQNQQIRDQQAITKTLEGLETERLGLSIQDKDQREIALTIRRQELELGRSLNDNERQRLTTATQLTQQAREQAAIAEVLLNATRQQTELEKIQRGLQLQSQLDPTGDLKKQYDRDLAALEAYHKATNTATTEALNQRAALEEQFQYRLLELQNQDLKNYDRINKLKEQMDVDRIQKTLENESRGMAAVLSQQDRAILQRRGADERQTAIVRERMEFEKKSEMEKAQFAIQQGANVFAALGAQNKKAFEAAKAFNIANAIMNTYMAATKALATYPFPFGLIAAAGAVAAGLAQVAQIRSQQYSGRRLGGPVMGGTPYMVGESGPELFVPNTTGSITRNNQLDGGQVTNVNFTIVANDTTGFDQLLASRKGIIQQIISDAMLEKGRRSMV
jgi:tape measure domain-containing protein